MNAKIEIRKRIYAGIADDKIEHELKGREVILHDYKTGTNAGNAFVRVGANSQFLTGWLDDGVTPDKEDKVLFGINRDTGKPMEWILDTVTPKPDPRNFNKSIIFIRAIR